VLEKIAVATKYDELEEYLVEQRFAIVSVRISPAFSDYATDRIYSFPIGSEYGTLLLEFESDSIIRRQIFFCNPSAWIVPLPDSAKTSGGTRKVYDNLVELLNSELGSSEQPQATIPRRRWSLGVELTFDSVSGLVTLDLNSKSITAIPWMIKPAGMPAFSYPKALNYGDPHVTRQPLRDFQDCLFGPDTLLGVPGVATSGIDSAEHLRLHIWNSIIGVGPNILDSFVINYERSLGPAASKRSNSATWILDSSVLRIVRIDSFTLYSIYFATVTSLRSGSASTFQDLHTEDIEFSQLAWCSESEEAESKFDRKTFTRKGIFIYDRFIKPSLERCRANGERRPSTLEQIWKD
jgi:hypothetical protein